MENIHINKQEMLFSNTGKYLHMILNTKLKYKEHVKQQQKLNIKFKENILAGRYKKMLSKTHWIYVIQL